MPCETLVEVEENLSIDYNSLLSLWSTQRKCT